MAIAFQNKARRLVPRWRDSATTAQRGELDDFQSREVNQADKKKLAVNAKQAEWEQHRTLSFAADFVGTALMFGQEEQAEPAALEILEQENASPMLQNLARRVLGYPEPLEQFDERQQISNLKKRLRINPRNAIAWTDLSLAHLVLGNTSRAKQIMATALSLAPNNRFVLRSGARLHVHVGEPDRALALLRQGAQVSHDPWLLSAEIAISQLTSAPSRFAKVGQKIIDGKKAHPFHLAELASALGTANLEAGSTRKARQLFSLSLEQPTENVVAQAEWVVKVCKMQLPTDPTQLAMVSSEGRTLDYFYDGAWKDSLEEAYNWFADQPFAPEAAILSTYIATVVNAGYETAIHIATKALRANSDNWVLRNNLSFAYAMVGNLEKANEMLKGFQSTVDPRSLGVLTATSGLLAFRGGDLIRARELYDLAVSRLESTSDKARALIFWALEEARIKSSYFAVVSERALDLATHLERADVKTLIRRLEKAKIDAD